MKVGATKIEGTNYKMGVLSKGATKHGEGRHYNRGGVKFKEGASHYNRGALKMEGASHNEGAPYLERALTI